MASRTEDGDYGPEDTERRAREAIRRSFELPYKPHKELVGKTPRARARKRAALKTKKPK
jgi:hypothetical protein